MCKRIQTLFRNLSKCVSTLSSAGNSLPFVLPHLQVKNGRALVQNKNDKILFHTVPFPSLGVDPRHYNTPGLEEGRVNPITRNRHSNPSGVSLSSSVMELEFGPDFRQGSRKL